MKNILLIITIILSSLCYGQKDLPRFINENDQIIHHKAYTLSYNETHEQANWVIYMVTKSDLIINVAKRKNNFKKDKDIPTGSATLKDYKGSGYDRGHLDQQQTFVNDQKEMDESFYMSNISPQNPSFNRGIWKKLESYEREMAIEKDTVYVICGGILTDSLETIGPNNVSVPTYYYKIIYTDTWMVCFLLKNEKSDEPLHIYIQTLTLIEELTKIDFNLK